MKLQILLAALLGTVGTLFAAPEYQLLLSGKTITPEALGTRSTFSGSGLSGQLRPGEKAEWIVESGKGDKDRWAALGIEWVNPRSVSPIGLRIELELPEAITFNIEPRLNDKPGKGFWSTRWLGRKKVEVPAGKQTLEFTWGELAVKEADWNKINAVSFSVGVPCRIGVLAFGLLYPEPLPVDAPTLVTWLDAATGEINPVARPFDKLTGVFSLHSGNGLSGKLEAVELPGVGKTASWIVRGEPGTRGWAVYGFGFIDPLNPPPSGLRFEVNFPRETELTLQVLKGFDRSKGFYTAKKSGVPQKMKFSAGRQFIDFDWRAFGVPEADLADINSVQFVANQANDQMDIIKVDLRFADAEKAAAYTQLRDKKLKEMQKTMIESLVARGVPWISLKERTAPQAEPWIWIGLQLAAQREQLNYFKKLFDAQQADRLLAENAKLIDAGPAGTVKAGTLKLQAAIDTYIDDALTAIPAAKRKFAYDDATRRFRYPSGEEFRMFGPFFFRSLYRPGLSEWRPWDLRYLAGLGFNGIRLTVTWNAIEPRQGSFDPEYLNMLKAIIREAERYGFGVSIDLHWPYPDWFVKGAPGFELSGRKLSAANSYHWPEALTDSWRRLGAEFAELPNIVAFEVPTNETPIGNDKDGLMASGYLMKRWNEFLKQEYRTRENLQAVWGAAADGAERYGLAPDEEWDKLSIRPLGFQNDGSADQAYESNPRFYDHLRFAAMMQKELSGNILTALRKSRPDAQAMFQRTIGDMWDKSPVPVDYHSILTSVGAGVLPGTHYNMGGIQARKAAALTLGSYDSEQQMEGNRNAVERHVALGLGFCPFAFHYRGGGGMLLADDDWHLKPEVGYLPKLADAVRHSAPREREGLPVAVIVNTRLEASTGANLGDLIDALEKRGCRVELFESLRILDEPALLDNSKLAITSTNYADLRLLDLLRERYRGKVLLTGRLDMDAYARAPGSGLPGYLAKHHFLLKTATVRRAAELAGKLDLAGNWQFCHTGVGDAVPTAPPAQFKATEQMKVPGLWGETGLTGSRQFRLGDGWYRKQIAIPAAWRGRPLKLKLGAVDDIDWAFWNGKRIGHTGEKTPNYWMVSREYTISPEQIDYGQTNTLVILVRNLRDDGGIWKAPAELSANAAGKMRFIGADGTDPAPCGGNTSLIAPDQLAENARLLAEFQIPDSDAATAALVQQDRFLWYFNDQEFDELHHSADGKVLDLAVRNAAEH